MFCLSLFWLHPAIHIMHEWSLELSVQEWKRHQTFLLRTRETLTIDIAHCRTQSSRSIFEYALILCIISYVRDM